MDYSTDRSNLVRRQRILPTEDEDLCGQQFCTMCFLMYMGQGFKLLHEHFIDKVVVPDNAGQDGDKVLGALAFLEKTDH